jgi:hypothetical protein
MDIKPLQQGLRSFAQWVKISIVILLFLVLSAVLIDPGYWFNLEHKFESSPLGVKIFLVLLLFFVLNSLLIGLGNRFNWGQRLKIYLLFLLVLVVIGEFINFGYWFNWDWTGFNGVYSKTTTMSTTHGITTATEQPLTRTLWDWLQLLIVPVVLAVGGYLLNLTINRNQQKFTDDSRNETALQAYIDKMSELLLINHQDNSKKNDNVQDGVKNVARMRTLLILRNLDEARKGSLFLFLSESGLIKGKNCIVDLSKADFSRADLSIAYLRNKLQGLTKVRKSWLDSQSKELASNLKKVNLSKAILIKANLSYASLNGANLSGASLHKADLSYANLIGADLKEADLDETNLSNADLTGAMLNCMELF